MPRVNTPGFHSPCPRRLGSALARSAPWMAAGVLVVLVIAGLTRDPSTVVLTARLAVPSARLPFGADALGRDLLARFGHDAVLTVGMAVAVTVLCLAVGLAIGLASRSGCPGPTSGAHSDGDARSAAAWASRSSKVASSAGLVSSAVSNMQQSGIRRPVRARSSVSCPATSPGSS